MLQVSLLDCWDSVRIHVGRKDGQMQDRRRKSPRFVKRCEVEFRAIDTTLRGISSNFSLGGLFIKTNHPLPEHTVFEIVVHLPNGVSSHLKGKVIRSIKSYTGKVMGRRPTEGIKSGMGVEILEMDDNYAAFIALLQG